MEMSGHMINLHGLSMPDASAWVWELSRETNRSYLFSFSTSLGRHCLHLKKQLLSAEISEPCIYLPDVRTCEKPSSGKWWGKYWLSIWYEVRRKLENAPSLQSSPIPCCFDIITVCVSYHGLSQFSSRCFTWATRFLCIYILNSSMC